MSSVLLFLLLAADTDSPAGMAPPAQSNVIQDVTDRPPTLVEKNNMRWSEKLGAEAAGDCGAPKVPCRALLLEVTNYSGLALQCHGTIQYPQPNPHGIKDNGRTVVIPSKKSWTMVRAEVPLDLVPTSHHVDCVPEGPPPPFAHSKLDCTFKINKSVNVDAYFPKESRDALHDGSVVVEFTLAAEEGAPSDIRVIRSSTYADLDAAAVRMFGEVPMSTNCPGDRFRTMAMFRLWY